jgi:hypothetical protein
VDRKSGAVKIFYGSAGPKQESKISPKFLNRRLSRSFIAMEAMYVLYSLATLRLVSVSHQYKDNMILVATITDVDKYWLFTAKPDINIAVLGKTSATDAKSEIKWTEAAMFGIPSEVGEIRPLSKGYRRRARSI